MSSSKTFTGRFIRFGGGGGGIRVLSEERLARTCEEVVAAILRTVALVQVGRLRVYVNLVGATIKVGKYVHCHDLYNAKDYM